MVSVCGDVVAYETGILLLQISSVLFFTSVAGGISLSGNSKRVSAPPRNSTPDLPETAEVIEMQEAAALPNVPDVDASKASNTLSFWPDEPRYHRASFQPQAVMTQRRPRALREINIEEQQVHAPLPAQPRPVTISFDMSQNMEFNL